MSERIVVNTSPLIAWGKMKVLDIISQLPYDFVCPTQVETEILTGEEQGYPVSFPSWIKRKFT